MFDNHLYDLLLQLTEEHKSLWRIRKMYKRDAKGCKTCQALWQKLEKDKTKHIQELKQLVKKHLK